MADDTPVIELRHVHVVHKARTGKLFRPDRVHAVNDVSLSISKGEVLGIVGESGCGKSTTARVMVGLQPVTEGEILFHGKPIGRGAEARRTLGRAVSVVFQDPATALNPRMSVRETLLDPFRVHGIGNAASRLDRVRDLLSMVGLPSPRSTSSPAESRAGSANASRSHAPWRWSRRSSSPTSPHRPSTSPYAPKSSTCSST